jgi:manganese oxidase
MVIADMRPDDVGVWLFHCHVNDHLTAGMATRYRVTT